MIAAIISNSDREGNGEKKLAFPLALAGLIAVVCLLSPSPARGQAATEYGGAVGVSAGVTVSKPEVFTPGGPGVPNASLFLAKPEGIPPEVLNQEWFEKTAGKNGGQVTITAVPAGSRVWVDQKYVGEAPVTLTLPAGKHHLSLEGKRQETASRDVKVEAGKTQKVAISLKEIYPTAVTIQVFGGPSN